MRLKIGDLWDQAFYGTAPVAATRMLSTSSATTDRQSAFFKLSKEDQKLVRRGGTELMSAEKFDKFIEGVVSQ